MACTYADDAYLIARWPQVVVSTPGIWLATVLLVVAGNYTLTVGGIPYVYAADGTETAEVIRDELIALVSLSLFVGVSPTGANAITLAQVQVGALTVTFTGPTDPEPDPPEVSLAQTAGTSNAAFRALILEEAKCGTPDCCTFTSAGCACGLPLTTCESDFTLWHASMAAHLIIAAQAMGPSGYSASSFQSMRLGPASLTRGANNYATPTETDLARTEPGKVVLMLRRRYLPPLFCV